MTPDELLQLQKLVEKFNATYPLYNVLLTTGSQDQVDELVFGDGPIDFVHFDIALDTYV